MAAYSDRLADDYLSLLQKLLQILKIDRDVVCTHKHVLHTDTHNRSFVATCDAYTLFTYLLNEKALFKMPYIHWRQKAAACNLSVFWYQVMQRSLDDSQFSCQQLFNVSWCSLFVFYSIFKSVLFSWPSLTAQRFDLVNWRWHILPHGCTTQDWQTRRRTTGPWINWTQDAVHDSRLIVSPGKVCV